METWGTAESSWQGCGESFGAVWGDLGRMDIPSPAPPGDEGTSGHHARPRSIPEQSRVSQHPDTSAKAPKSQITASSSQGFAYQPGERQPPPTNKVISKIKQNIPSPSPARGAKEPNGEVPAWCCTQQAGVLETQRGKPWGGHTRSPPKRARGRGETPQGANKGTQEQPARPPRRVASLRLPLLTYGGSCQIKKKKKKKIQAAQSFPFRQLHP